MDTNLDLSHLKERAVTSKEGSKRLAELGMPQISLFWWNVNVEDDNKSALNYNEKFIENGHWKNYAAFTIDELGSIIKMIRLEDIKFPPDLSNDESSSEEIHERMFNVHYWEELLIWLIENKKIELVAASS